MTNTGRLARTRWFGRPTDKQEASTSIGCWRVITQKRVAWCWQNSCKRRVKQLEDVEGVVQRMADQSV